MMLQGRHGGLRFLRGERRPPTACRTGTPEPRDWHSLGDYRERPAEPFNDHEPVDSSAAAIAAQGLLRLGRYLQGAGDGRGGCAYWQAGLTVLRTLLGEPYLSLDPQHKGCCCTRSTIVRAVGTMCRRVRGFRAANPACGAITTCAKWRCTSSASPKARPIMPSTDRGTWLSYSGAAAFAAPGGRGR